eukprot:6190977-Pleurochrysis_carterae.AAC.1
MPSYTSDHIVPSICQGSHPQRQILPISTQGKESIRPDSSRWPSYLISVTHNGRLRLYFNSSRCGSSFALTFYLARDSDIPDHLCQFLEESARGSPLSFDSRKLYRQKLSNGTRTAIVGAASARSVEALDEARAN